MKPKDILKSPLYLITLSLCICLAVAFLISEIGQEDEYVDIEDKKLDIKTTTIFLNVSPQQRLLRSLNREGKMDSKAVDEVIRRYIDDNNKIMPHMSEYDIVLTNETVEDLQRNVKIIKSLIEK